MSRLHNRGRSGFTLTDLNIALCLLALLFAYALPAVSGRSRETANRIKCASNLRQIGYGIQLYVNENNQQYPRTYFDAAATPVPTEYTAWQVAKSFAPNGPGPNDVSAALFLVLKTQDLTPKEFVCPTGQSRPWDYGGQDKTMVSNFPGREFLGYGYTNPYPGQHARNKGFKLNTALSSDFAVAADMSPGGPLLTTISPAAPREQMKKVNSPNHGGDGQNLLYADGHVDWATTPFAGVPRGPTMVRDNVYAAEADAQAGIVAAVRASPTDRDDSVILPTYLDGPQPPARVVSVMSVLGNPLVLIGLLVLAGMVAAAVVLFLRLKRRPTLPPPLPPGV